MSYFYNTNLSCRKLHYMVNKIYKDKIEPICISHLEFREQKEHLHSQIPILLHIWLQLIHINMKMLFLVQVFPLLITQLLVADFLPSQKFLSTLVNICPGHISMLMKLESQIDECVSKMASCRQNWTWKASFPTTWLRCIISKSSFLY